jgi:uncharacterized protein YegL
VAQQPYQSGFAFDPGDFASNPDPRAPCVLALDTSGSMSGQAIRELNEGLRAYQQDLIADSLAARRVELAVVSFGGKVELVQDFVSPAHYVPTDLLAEGDTPMAEAVMRGVHLLEKRKEIYRANGISYYRPWIFLFTDGEPTDNAQYWNMAQETVRRGEAEGKFTFFAFGVAGANFAKLKELTGNRSPLQLKGRSFRDFFVWLSNSQQRVSQASVGANVRLLPATGDSGWAEVPT